MKQQAIVSQMDIEHYALIRKNVSDFISYCSKQYDKKGKLLLDIAPQDHEGAKASFKRCRIKTLDINHASGADYIADITRNNEALIPGDHFDYVLCTEVLEHTLNPFAAVEEITRVAKKGGLVFVSVPFNFRIHGPLPDCWRFTEHGLRALFSKHHILKLNEIATVGRDLMPIHYTLIVQKQ